MSSAFSVNGVNILLNKTHIYETAKIIVNVITTSIDALLKAQYEKTFVFYLLFFQMRWFCNVSK